MSWIAIGYYAIFIFIFFSDANDRWLFDRAVSCVIGRQMRHAADSIQHTVNGLQNVKHLLRFLFFWRSNVCETVALVLYLVQTIS